MTAKLDPALKRYLSTIGRTGGLNRWAGISEQKRKTAMSRAGLASGIARRKLIGRVTLKRGR